MKNKLFFLVPCPFSSWEIMNHHNFLCLETFFITITHIICSVIHIYKLDIQVTHYFHLSFFLQYALVANFLCLLFFILCTSNCNCPFLILRISFCFLSIFLKTSSLFKYFVDSILSILLQNYLSLMSSLFFICKEISMDSLPFWRI